MMTVMFRKLRPKKLEHISDNKNNLVNYRSYDLKGGKGDAREFSFSSSPANDMNKRHEIQETNDDFLENEGELVAVASTSDATSVYVGYISGCKCKSDDFLKNNHLTAKIISPICGNKI